MRARAEHLRAQRDLLRKRREAERNSTLETFKTQKQEKPAVAELPALPAGPAMLTSPKAADAASPATGARNDLTRRLAREVLEGGAPEA